MVKYQTEGFDPGSERTLAAWIRHASRARTVVLATVHGDSGERVSNVWTTYPPVWDNFGKLELIPDGFSGAPALLNKDSLS